MAINRIKTGGITDGTITTTDIAPGTIANDRLAGSIANAKLANSAITINGTSIALGASGEIVAGTDWQAVTVADGSTQLTAEAGKGYFLDTNTGVIEVLLPASPSRGDTFTFADYGGNFATNNVIVNTRGKNVDSTEGGPGSSSDFKLATNNQIVSFVYVDSAKGYITYKNASPSTPSAVAGGSAYGATFISATGGTVTTSGDFKIHTFTGDSNFVVSELSSEPANNAVSYIVVAGGGSGGGAPTQHTGGGGGAGGFREGKTPAVDPYTASPLAAPTGITVTAQTYPITVGGGGASAPQPNNGNEGSNSVFSTITSTGGGGGGSGSAPPGANACRSATNGGSGGGGSSQTAGTGGSGNTPPVSPSQGNNGAQGVDSPPDLRSGGGGGATQAGSQGRSPGRSGEGGAGATTEITGSSVTYAGGGGGGVTPHPFNPQAHDDLPNGGPGGGGEGGRDPASQGPGDDVPGTGQAGTANTGGGAGGATASNVGNSGGKGVVILRYKFQ